MTSNIVKFIYKNKIVEIKNPDTNETILNYVRTKLKKTGTKEGCAEGGCGACTVVIGELEKNNIKYKAINSCISFLPNLESKQLILVEDLIDKGELHPVQKAMVNFHGSQCGFCTPGFVMSLFAMYKNYSSFKEEIIRDSIQGNLCRCTGYRPIVAAAKSLNKNNKRDSFSRDKKITLNLLKKINKRSIAIVHNNKKYFAPKSINELSKILRKEPNSKLISGGTDLSLIVTKNRQEIKNIILLGCGTSYNACIVGYYYLRQIRQLNIVRYIDGSEFNKYDIPHIGKTLVIFCSQSGETKDLHRCVKIAQEKHGGCLKQRQHSGHPQ